MDSDRDERIEPVCRFGPGGDFISVWPLESARAIQPSPNRLAKLLTSLSEIITALLGSEFDTATVPTDIRRRTNHLFAEKEKSEDAVGNNKADKPAHATPATIIKSHSRFSGEPVLFADDWRIGLRTGHKPKHRIRTYRRTAKKRPAFGLSGQVSLFETNFKSARTA